MVPVSHKRRVHREYDTASAFRERVPRTRHYHKARKASIKSSKVTSLWKSRIDFFLFFFSLLNDLSGKSILPQPRPAPVRGRRNIRYVSTRFGERVTAVNLSSRVHSIEKKVVNYEVGAIFSREGLVLWFFAPFFFGFFLYWQKRFAKKIKTHHPPQHTARRTRGKPLAVVQ